MKLGKDGRGRLKSEALKYHQLKDDKGISHASTRGSSVATTSSSGSSAPILQRLHNVLEYLKTKDLPVSRDKLREDIGYDLEHDAELLAVLKGSAKIRVEEDETMFSYVSKYQINDKNGLLELIALKECTKLSEIKDSFLGASEAIDELLRDHLIIVIPLPNALDSVIFSN